MNAFNWQTIRAEVIQLQYTNLHDLILGSSSTRRYFLSLPTDMQMQLHEYNDLIHSAAELHAQVGLIDRYRHAVAIADSMNGFLKKK